MLLYVLPQMTLSTSRHDVRSGFCGIDGTVQPLGPAIGCAACRYEDAALVAAGRHVQSRVGVEKVNRTEVNLIHFHGPVHAVSAELVHVVGKGGLLLT